MQGNKNCEQQHWEASKKRQTLLGDKSDKPALVPVIPIQAGTGRSHGKAQVFLIKPRRERGAAKNTPKMDLNSSAALPSTGIDALPVVQNL